MFESIFNRVQHRNHLLLTAGQDGGVRKLRRNLRLLGRARADGDAHAGRRLRLNVRSCRQPPVPVHRATGRLLL